MASFDDRFHDLTQRLTSLGQRGASQIPHQELGALAAEWGQHAEHTEAIADAVDQALSTATSEGRILLWYLIDKLCKQVENFTPTAKKRLLGWSKSYAPKSGDPMWPKFEPVLHSLSVYIDKYIMALVEKDLRVHAASTPAAPSSGQSSTPSVRSSTALIAQDQLLRSMGSGFMQLKSNSAPSGPRALQVRTKDSLMAMRAGSAFAPAMPAEVVVQHSLVPDTDAPQGYMQALPTNHQSEYLDNRRKRLREVMEASRRQLDDEESRSKAQQRTKASLMAQRAADDIVMPLELPRDEYGVKIGNYPEGVRFLRDAIRSAGGALELEVIVQRIATMSEREAVKEFGNVREFINIHRPTFYVSKEHDKWVIRLTEDENRPIAYDSNKDQYAWEELPCPGCSRLLPARNLIKHKNSRRCIGIQLSNGLNGSIQTAISELSYAAKVIRTKLQPALLPDGNLSGEEPDFDDDDLDWFRRSIEDASAEKRFRLAAPHHFLPILSSIRLVRDYWLRLRGAAEMSELTVSWEDRSFVAFFGAIGRNIRRLPIPWIESGDVIDMCRRFTYGTLPPHPPPPRAGDPRIRIHNPYPGLLFADSDEDDDDIVSGEEDNFSDDEAPAFEYAPPVTLVETIMVPGRIRDTKKLNYRLRTAPPMQVLHVVQNGGEKTMEQVHAESGKRNLGFGQGALGDTGAAQSWSGSNQGHSFHAQAQSTF